MTAGTADKPHDRADIDDGPTAGPRHLLGSESGAEKDTRLVDRDDPVPAVETIGVADGTAGDAGIVDQNVEPAIGRQCLANQTRPFCFVGDVDLGRECLATAGADGGGDHVRVLSKDVGDDDLGTLVREKLSLGFAHAVGAAGNYRNLLFQAHH